MIFFTLFSSFLIPILFAANLQQEIDTSNLIHSFRKVVDYFGKQRTDPSFEKSFMHYYKGLTKFLDFSYENDPKTLFEIVRANENFPLAHFIISVLTYWRGVDFGNRLWNKNYQFRHQDKCFNFFKGARQLMFQISRKENWTISKDVLGVLLQIQRQYLFKLVKDENKMARAKKWIYKYEIIYSFFDPKDVSALVGLFGDIRCIANTFDKSTLKTLHHRLLYSFNLFYLSCYHFRCFNQDLLEIDSVPKDLVTIILVHENQMVTFTIQVKKELQFIKAILRVLSIQFV
jgi:hypothetical protein